MSATSLSHIVWENKKVVHEIAAFLERVRGESPAVYEVVRFGLRLSPVEPRLLFVWEKKKGGTRLAAGAR